MLLVYESFSSYLGLSQTGHISVQSLRYAGRAARPIWNTNYVSNTLVTSETSETFQMKVGI